MNGILARKRNFQRFGIMTTSSRATFLPPSPPQVPIFGAVQNYISNYQWAVEPTPQALALAKAKPKFLLITCMKPT